MNGCLPLLHRIAAAILPPRCTSAGRIAGVATAVPVLLALVAGCRDAASDAHAGIPRGVPRRVAVVYDLPGPESAKYDPDQDAWLVSNMTGYGSVKDNTGAIVRISATNPNESSVLVKGGMPGVTLHAPKGLAIHGDTLWTADIDVLRGFHRRSGAPLAAIDFQPLGVALINDVALAPDGTLRVTDTGINMSPKGVIYRGGDRIFSVGPGGLVRVVAQGAQLRRPNGILWSDARKQWLVASFDPFISSVYSLDATGAPHVLGRGKGKWDGVEILPDGRIIASSWTDSSIYVVDRDSTYQLIRGVPEPADLGVDTRRNRIAVPVSVMGRLEVWQLP